MSPRRPPFEMEQEDEFLGGILRDNRLDPEAGGEVDVERFNVRLLRNWKVANGRSSIRYWMPAFIGASIASLSLLAALQMLSQPASMQPIRQLKGDAAQRFEIRDVDMNALRGTGETYVR